MDDNVYLLMLESTPIGVYTHHRKATQELYMRTFRQNLTFESYTYDMGIEYFNYTDNDGVITRYSIRELTPDERVF